MRTITPFDPSATPDGTIQTNLANSCSVLYLINESNIGIKLLFADGSTGVVPAWFTRAFRLTTPNAYIQWQQLYTVNGLSPINPQVYGEGYEPNEVDWRQLATGPLTRQINIGNSVPVSGSSSSVVNDGNAANTVVVEATQSGASGSNVLIENDGTVMFREGTVTLLDLLKLIPGATIAVLLGSASRAVQSVGDFLVNTGKIGVAAAGDLIDASSSSTTNIKTRAAGTVNLQPNGVTQAAVSSSGLILPAGQIGVSSAGDTLDASSSSTTNLKTRAAGTINLQPAGTTQAAVSSSGLVIAAGKIGMSAAGDILDAATVATQLNVKSGGGDLVFYQGSTEVFRITNAGNIRFPGGLIGISADGDLIDASSATDLYIKTRTAGGNVNFQLPGGSTIASIGGGGLTFQSGKHIQWGSGDTLGITHSLTVNYTGGGANQTFSHGLSSTPFIVIPVLAAGGSATVGVSSITSTQFTMAAGVNGNYKVLCMVG
jgi:hypothetical protein